MSVAQSSPTSSYHLPVEMFLVYGGLRIGGIETLIVRTANFFVSQGSFVSVFCRSGGELETHLDSRVNIISYSETTDLVDAVQTHKAKTHRKSSMLIISFDPISAARALRVERELFQKNLLITHVSGVFHPRAYFMTGERKDRVLLNYLVARAVGFDRLLFMNEECRVTHSTRWGVDLSRSQIVPLPVNGVNATWQPSNNKAIRIVSVGRLVDFKAYNLGAASIVRACRDRGVVVTWDIFGDGPLRILIEIEIEASGVSSDIRLMGPLEYNEFSGKVSSYDLFVGMGTAALEAAMVGVPTICATVDEATRCYGYLHDLPFGNVGELQEKPPAVEVTDLIQRYALTTPTQRVLLSQQSRAVADKYGMPKFAESVANMVNTPNLPPSKLFKRVISDLYRFATESSLAKWIRRRITQKARVA